MQVYLLYNIRKFMFEVISSHEHSMICSGKKRVMASMIIL